MWIESKQPHMWHDDPRPRLDVGLAPANGTSSPCGKNPEASSTDLSTGGTLSHPIHILETPKLTVHIWGSDFADISRQFGTSPQQELLIHKLSRVIHKFQGWEASMGDSPAPYM